MARMITTERSLKRETLGARVFSAAESSQKQKPAKGGGDKEASGGGEGSKKLAKKGKELKEDMDSLMEDIDAVLEENAEEFVKNYVQRGGE